MKRTLFDFAFKIKTTNRETPDEHVCQTDASQSAVPAALTEKESETDLRKDGDSSDGDSGMRKLSKLQLFLSSPLKNNNQAETGKSETSRGS